MLRSSYKPSGSCSAATPPKKLVTAPGYFKRSGLFRNGVHNSGTSAGKISCRFRYDSAMKAAQGAHEWTMPEACDKAWAATPTLPGVYKWYLQGDLPMDFNWPPPLAPISQGDLIYIGRASSLRTRAKHHKLLTSKSTLRRALASLMGMQAEWRGNSAHPGLIRDHEKRLTTWMTQNLSMSFVALDESTLAETTEKSLRTTLRPPLNRDGMTAEQLHTSAAAAAMQRNAIGARGSKTDESARKSLSPGSVLPSAPTCPESTTMTERMALTKTLYAEGWTRSQIANRVGVHVSTIGDYIAKLRTRGELDTGRD